MLLRNNHSSSFFIVDKIIFQKPLAICIALMIEILFSKRFFHPFNIDFINNKAILKI